MRDWFSFLLRFGWLQERTMCTCNIWRNWIICLFLFSHSGWNGMEWNGMCLVIFDCEYSARSDCQPIYFELSNVLHSQVFYYIYLYIHLTRALELICMKWICAKTEIHCWENRANVLAHPGRKWDQSPVSTHMRDQNTVNDWNKIDGNRVILLLNTIYKIGEENCRFCWCWNLKNSTEKKT